MGDFVLHGGELDERIRKRTPPEYQDLWKVFKPQGRANVALDLARAKAGAALDAVLISVEHALTDPRGLPGRPWYQHLIYAPGFYTGYGVKTLPAVVARRGAY